MDAYRRSELDDGFTAPALDVVVEVVTEWDPDAADYTRVRFWNNDASADASEDDTRGILSIGVVTHKVQRKFGVVYLGTVRIRMTNTSLTWLKSKAGGTRDNLDLYDKWLRIYIGKDFTGTLDDGETMFPYFHGKIKGITVSTDGTVTLECMDAVKEMLDTEVAFNETGAAGSDIHKAPYAVYVSRNSTEWTNSGENVYYDSYPGDDKLGAQAAPWDSILQYSVIGSLDYETVGDTFVTAVENVQDATPEYSHSDRPVKSVSTGGYNSYAVPKAWYIEYGPTIATSAVGTFKTYRADDDTDDFDANYRFTDGWGDVGTVESGRWLYFKQDVGESGESVEFRIGSGITSADAVGVSSRFWSSLFTLTQHGFQIDSTGETELVDPPNGQELQDWNRFTVGDKWRLWEWGSWYYPFSNESGVESSYISTDIGDVFPLQVLWRMLEHHINLGDGLRRPKLTWDKDGSEETGGNNYRYALDSTSFSDAVAAIKAWAGSSWTTVRQKMVTVGSWDIGTKWVEIVQDCLKAALCGAYVGGDGSLRAVSLGEICDTSGVAVGDYLVGDPTSSAGNLLSAKQDESVDELVNYLTINHKTMLWGESREGDNIYEDTTSQGLYGERQETLSSKWRMPDGLADDYLKVWFFNRYAVLRNRLNAVCTLSGALNISVGDGVVLSGESLLDDYIQGDQGLRCYEFQLDPMRNKIMIKAYQDDTGLAL